MIAYVRGRFDAFADADDVLITTAAGDAISARLFAPSGRAGPGDAVVAATATITIGVADHARPAFLGPWRPAPARPGFRGPCPADGPEPSGPLGLAATPVVLLPEASVAPIARAGIERAGRGASVASFDGPTEALGLELLSATSSGTEVVIVDRAVARHVDLVRILGGRAVVALPGTGPNEAKAWLAEADLDAELPIPTVDNAAWAAIAAIGLEATHQLVHVDPAPAFHEAGMRIAGATPAALTAGAAGVLAGRIAARNRRWRAALEP